MLYDPDHVIWPTHAFFKYKMGIKVIPFFFIGAKAPNETVYVQTINCER